VVDSGIFEFCKVVCFRVIIVEALKGGTKSRFGGLFTEISSEQQWQSYKSNAM
jgi:hypothetical protein